MAKAKVAGAKRTGGAPPALTPEARENQLIALAVDLAEQQLRDGTASSQVISHFLKLGSTKAELEKEKLRTDNELSRAKAENLRSQQRQDEMFQAAIEAMRRYQGAGGDSDEY